MQPVEDRHTFSSYERIKSSQSVREVLDADLSLWTFPIKCYYRFYDSAIKKCNQLAVIVPKRRFHHAVDRNRIKRLMRESYRLQKQILQTPDNVRVCMCWIYQGKEIPDFETVRKTVSSILIKLSHKINPS